MMSRAMTNSYLRECHLAAWRIKTGLTEEDYRELKAAHLARTGKSHPAFNYMWHEHNKINQKIEDVGSRMLRLEFRTLRNLQTAWRDVETRIENFESLYGLALRRNLRDAITGEKNLHDRYIDSWTK